jgi:hypothetical protein
MAVAVSHATTATLPNDPSKEISSDAWNEEHEVSGLGDSATLDVGTAVGTVAAGDHNHDAAYEPKNANIQTHVAAAHAPSDAQKNSDITKAEIEAVLTGEIESHTHPAGAGGATMDEVIDNLYPVGALYISTLSTNPGTLIGRGTWAAFGAGRVLVGIDAGGDTDFDTAEETGGAKTKAISAHAGTAVADHAAHTHSVTSNVAVADHASHTHTYTEIVQHTHPATDAGHTHTIPVGATDDTSAPFDRADAGTNASGANATTATGTGTASVTTSNPVGSVATGTTNGPSATLSHSVTNNAVTSGNPSATLTHSVTQPSAHTDLNVVQPYIVVYMWKRTA